MLLSLQAARAAAAALVVLFHLGGTFAQDRYFGFKALDVLFVWGDAGVDFFFVLSGFLIMTVHRRDIGRPQALGGYLVKRLLRIYPSYWLVSAAVLAAAWVVPSLRSALPADLPTLIAALLLLPQDPAIVGGTGSPILFVAWSLHFEMLFYAVFALAIASRAAGFAAVLALAVAVVVVQSSCQAAGSCGFVLEFLGSPMLLLFAMGVAAALLTASSARVPRPAWLAGAGITGFVGFGLIEIGFGRDPFSVDRRLIYGALASLIVIGLARAEAAGAVRCGGGMVKLLGDASYALYLLHIPIISVGVKLAAGLGLSSTPALLMAYLALFAACVVAAVVFHITVERRLLRLFRRGPPSAVAAASVPQRRAVR